MILRVCKVCGKVFFTSHPKKATCNPGCAHEERLKRQKEYAETNRKKTKERQHKQKIEREEKIEKQQANKSALVETAVAARAAGMTYGQYVAMQSAQRNRIIRKVLK